MSQTVLELRDVGAGYQGLAVARNLSLRVEEGQIVALLGPNGAGKTTTLLTIAGLLRPISGTIEVLGLPAGAVPPHRLARRGLAFVPEDRSLFYGLTVGENLKLASGQGSTERALEHFPALRPLLNRPAGLLSGGEQQMLTLGRAIALRPRLLVVDELSLGLAPVVVERLLPALRRVADETGCGVLLVEQQLRIALELSDYAHVIAHGEPVAQGPTADLARDPQLLESSYLGSTVLTGTTERR